MNGSNISAADADALKERGMKALHIGTSNTPQTLCEWIAAAFIVGGAPYAARKRYYLIKAAEHFRNAGKAYKWLSAWQSAEDCYNLASRAYAALNTHPAHAAEAKMEAAYCALYSVGLLEDTDPEAAVSAFRRAINSMQGTDFAAQACKDMAELIERKFPAAKTAVLDAYIEAAGMLEKADGKRGAAATCRLKVASMLLLDKDKDDDAIKRAADIYEHVGHMDGITWFTAKDTYVRCLLCHMATGNIANAHTAMQRIVDSSRSTFHGTREHLFLERLLGACDRRSLAEFVDACTEFDRVEHHNDRTKMHLIALAKDHIIAAAVEEKKEREERREDEEEEEEEEGGE